VRVKTRRDGKELFYLSPDNTLMAAAVNGYGDAFVRTGIQPLFVIAPALAIPPYDVSMDGSRFLVNAILPEPPTPITLLLSWPAIMTK
jgi:hypothetical protein